MSEGTKDFVFVVLIVAFFGAVACLIAWGGYTAGTKQGWCDGMGGTKIDRNDLCIINEKVVEIP